MRKIFCCLKYFLWRIYQFHSVKTCLNENLIEFKYKFKIFLTTNLSVFECVECILYLLFNERVFMFLKNTHYSNVNSALKPLRCVHVILRGILVQVFNVLYCFPLFWK